MADTGEQVDAKIVIMCNAGKAKASAHTPRYDTCQDGQGTGTSPGDELMTFNRPDAKHM